METYVVTNIVLYMIFGMYLMGSAILPGPNRHEKVLAAGGATLLFALAIWGAVVL